MQAEIAAIRFGMGARPGELDAAAADPRGWLAAQIKGAVPLATSTPLASSEQIIIALLAAREERQQMRRAAAESGDAKLAFNPVRAANLPHYREQVLARAQSAALTSTPFAERLVHFWSNHFAVSTDKGELLGLAGTLENEAIRPHVGGRFADMLIAVEQHPAMIAFLDNQYSIGEHSEVAVLAAQRQAKRAANGEPARRFGINENLAREILELHTLGVNGGYSQTDVTTFAEIITGWSIGGGKGRLAGGAPGRFYFRQNMHQPGPKTFLGKSYREDGQAQGEAVLEDLSRNPATAQFIATKLVRHFVADDPPPTVVARVARAFSKSGGDLLHAYAALIESSEAWNADARKFKTPEDFVFSALRALEATPQQPEEVLRSFELLGQRPYTPGSPAGWPDTAKSWDGSDALMRRVLWSTRAAAKYEKGIPPAQLAVACLGKYARAETLTALSRATSSSQAVALLLMSPEFQRR
jgi:uncharacterized protein (DUF1800 family)